jgi:hypothetical protein
VEKALSSSCQMAARPSPVLLRPALGLIGVSTGVYAFKSTNSAFYELCEAKVTTTPHCSSLPRINSFTAGAAGQRIVAHLLAAKDQESSPFFSSSPRVL